MCMVLQDLNLKPESRYESATPSILGTRKEREVVRCRNHMHEWQAYTVVSLMLASVHVCRLSGFVPRLAINELLKRVGAACSHGQTGC